MSLYCNKEDLISESDVEQKLIYPFLTESYPRGCSYKPKDVLTKHSIKSQTIGKSNKRIYYPDYIVAINGTPVMVVEAKRPNIDVYEAFSEARLYANEINAKFTHAINPCRNIIVSNGLITIAGYSDCEEPFITVKFSDIVIGNINYSKLLDFASKNTLVTYSKELLNKIKGKAKYFRPVGEIGGKKAQNSERQENSFGRTISLDYNHILIPESEEDYKVIVQNAYVESKRREQHVEPILKTIRSVKLPSINDETTLISSEDSSLLLKGIGNYVQKKDKRNSLILLVGSVGSGKTTFIRYIKNKIIDKDPDLNNNTNWIIINMNAAPISRDSIYGWLLNGIIEKIKEEYLECNFGNKEFLSKLYSEKIKEFENGVGSYLSSSPAEYNRELYQVVKDATNDKELTLSCLLTYLSTYIRKNCIIVLDNVDKGAPQDQLLMFQVAEWLRNQFSCLVVLPMRDTTYNMHRTAPPLDTVIKGLVFRIDPPDLLKVLQLRLNYIYRTKKIKVNNKDYMLENGMKVRLRDDEHLEYLKSLLRSIRNDSLIRSIFYSITGRDTRSGIELFIDFCKSGHINAREFLMVKAAGGEYTIPNYMMMNAIIRGNRFYYSDIESRIKNMFASEYNDDWVDPFIRVDILRWLDRKKSIPGPSGVKGFHRGDMLTDELSMIGHNSEATLRELVYLIRNKLIIAESHNDEFEKSDLIRISQYGILHIYLLSNITYLAACSEDVLYRNSEITKRISDRIIKKTGEEYLSKSNTIYNVEDMLNYLRDYRKKYLSLPNGISNSCDFDIYDLEKSFRSLEQTKINSKRILNQEEKVRKYPVGLKVDCMVLNIKEYGIFITIDFEEEGFIPKNKLKGIEPDGFEITDILQAKIVAYRKEHERFELELIEKVG